MTETTVAIRRVVVGTARHIENVCRDVNAALIASEWSDPRIFIHQNELVYLDAHSGNGAGPILRPMTVNLLRALCISRFQCVKPERPVAGTDEDADEEDESVETTVAPITFSTARPMPQDVASMFVECSDFWVGLPHLTSMVSLPFFGRDGALVQEHGYDADSHIYYWKPVGFDLPRPVPVEPSQDAIDWARHWLIEELFVDFPFGSQADRANTAGMLLSPFIMQMIECPLPLFVFTADNPGVGKSLLSEICGQVLCGSSPPKAPWPAKDEEFEKKIYAIFTSAATASMVIWDNVPEGTTVDSPLLATLHTARNYSGRTLGQSEFRTFHNDKVWAITGNSLTTGGDMARRSVYCSLAAAGPHPEDRLPESFRHPRLRQWVRDNRATLVLACLTLVRAWQAAGRPQPSTEVSPMGDYAPWVEAVGGILEVAGIEGFLTNVKDRRANSDDDVAMGESLLEVIAGKFGASPDLDVYPEYGAEFNALDVANALRGMDSTLRQSMQFPVLIDKWLGQTWEMDDKKLPAAIGKWMSRYANRWSNGGDPMRRVKCIRTVHKVKQYRLEERHDVADPAAALAAVTQGSFAPTAPVVAPPVPGAAREADDRRR